MRKHKYGYWIFMAVFLICTIGPFIWAFLISVTPEYGMFTKTADLLPKEITWDNYKVLLFEGSREGKLFFTGIINSLKAVAVTLLIGIPAAVMSAYALARMEFKGRKLIKNLLLFTMVIPVMATIIPIYRIFTVYQLLDKIFWLSLIYVSSLLPVAVWLISNYFATIPRELEEAALVDGCGTIKAFIKIILPASYPVIVSTVLILFLNTWSQFQIPLILASSPATKPIAIITSEFMTKDAVKYGLTAAAGICAVIPPVVLALLLRKYLISGMTGGAVKE